MSITQYRTKDRVKFKICNKLISRGCEGSSSHYYQVHGILPYIVPEAVNCKDYTADDVVGISSNGMRISRMPADLDLISKAMEQGVTFVLDSAYDRGRTYNIGEREVYDFLINKGYKVSAEERFRTVLVPDK